MAHDLSYPRTATLDASLEDQWTLHHMLQDRLEREAAAEGPSPLPPQLAEVARAFEALDTGDRRFTVPQLEAIRALLAEYRSSPAWEDDRESIERLHDEFGEMLDRRRTAPLAD
jgi:hypothetical protein